MIRATTVRLLSLLFFIITISFAVNCIQGGSEVIADMGGSEVVGKVVREDNVPVANIDINALLITSHDSAGHTVFDTIYSDTTTSNDTGFFKFDSLPQGSYILYAQYKDDSLVMPKFTFSPDPVFRLDLKTITMVAPGSVSGMVSKNWAGTGSPVFCCITGTSHIAIADPVSGKFIISSLPPGTYDILVFSEDFDPYTFCNVQVASGNITEIGQAVLQLNPIGKVPVPAGLSLQYSPRQNEAVVTWNRIPLSNVNRYVVYSASRSLLRKDTIQDTFATVFTDVFFEGTDDTLTIYFQVSALNDDNNESMKSSLYSIKALPQSWYEVNMSLHTDTTVKGGDIIPVLLEFSSRCRTFSSITWGADHSDSVIKKTILDNVTSGKDTLYWEKFSGKQKIFVTLWDSSNTPVWIHTDSIDATTFQPVNTWDSLSSLGEERRYAGACAINGKIYIFGGAKEKRSMSGTTTLVGIKTAEMYDPSTKSYSFIGSMNAARQSAAYCVWKDRIYVFGGTSGTTDHLTVESYDPFTNIWSIVDTMKQSLVGAAACTYNGKIIITGGISGTLDSSVILNTVFSYDPATRTWENTGSLHEARYMHQAIVTGSSILLIGGLGYNHEAEELTAVTSTECLFNNESNLCSNMITLENGCYGFGAAVVSNKLVVLGGLRSSSVEDLPLTNVDVYMTDNASHYAGKAMDIGCEGMAVAEYNGGLYMFGGNAGGTSVQKSSKAAYVYYP